MFVARNTALMREPVIFLAMLVPTLQCALSHATTFVPGMFRSGYFMRFQPRGVWLCGRVVSGAIITASIFESLWFNPCPRCVATTGKLGRPKDIASVAFLWQEDKSGRKKKRRLQKNFTCIFWLFFYAVTAFSQSTHSWQNSCVPQVNHCELHCNDQQALNVV